MMASKSNSVDPKWDKFLCTHRLRPSKVKNRSEYDARTEFENDYDRIIFASSFRRLKNKAQVFSLDGHDFVRTRLTHSIEVSTIGRALGEGVAKHLSLVDRDVGNLLATVCLLHDIGNPPFGHSGERAIGSWFNSKIGANLKINDSQERDDLRSFEGNAQALRIATRTQWSGTDYGMNLTAATLSVLIKYPCSSIESTGKKGVKERSKFGYFKDDQLTFERIRQMTGLQGYLRHPLTYLMEAADDIAYAAGDLEDVLKKGLVDYDTVCEILNKTSNDIISNIIQSYLIEVYNGLSSVKYKRERQQIAVQRFCQMAVRLMTKSAIECFVSNADAIINGEFNNSIVEAMNLAGLCQALKDVMEGEVYPHLDIAHREQAAERIIHGLLDAVAKELESNPKGTLAERVYVQSPRHTGETIETSAAYQLSLRMTDFASGMTDGFALAEYQRINAMGKNL